MQEIGWQPHRVRLAWRPPWVVAVDPTGFARTWREIEPGVFSPSAPFLATGGDDLGVERVPHWVGDGFVAFDWAVLYRLSPEGRCTHRWQASGRIHSTLNDGERVLCVTGAGVTVLDSELAPLASWSLPVSPRGLIRVDGGWVVRGSDCVVGLDGVGASSWGPAKVPGPLFRMGSTGRHALVSNIDGRLFAVSGSTGEVTELDRGDVMGQTRDGVWVVWGRGELGVFRLWRANEHGLQAGPELRIARARWGTPRHAIAEASATLTLIPTGRRLWLVGDPGTDGFRRQLAHDAPALAQALALGDGRVFALADNGTAHVVNVHDFAAAG